TLEINLQSENFVKIIVFDLTGDIALPPQIISGLPGDILNCSLDGSTLRPGCYLVQIQGENQRTTLRWTVGR
ncbi:MAG TPA: hypothetical protein DDZ19_07555, partial [Flavobacteriales bacterium]|nr:hypothetical protein [Flavobacteriales bacterium]